MAVPIVFLGTLGLAFGILWMLTHFGDPTAEGESVRIEFSGACIDSAAPLLIERAFQVGMPARMEGGTMHTTLPDIEQARTSIPQMLATPGHFALTGTGVEMSNDDIEDVAIELNNAGMPETLLKLNADARALIRTLDDSVELTPAIDGEPMPPFKVSTIKEEGIVVLHAGEGKTADRMKRAADRAILLAHGPLPCSISVRGVQSAVDHE
jgi:hypothetical protein